MVKVTKIGLTAFFVMYLCLVIGVYHIGSLNGREDAYWKGAEYGVGKGIDTMAGIIRKHIRRDSSTHPVTKIVIGDTDVYYLSNKTVLYGQ